MPISAETLRKLMAAGLAGEELLDVVSSIEADYSPRARTANAERQARFRARKRNQDTVTESVTNNVTRNVTLNPTPLDKENTPKPLKEINPPAQPRAYTCEGKPAENLDGLQKKLAEAAGDKIQPHGIFDLSPILGLIGADVDLETDILPAIRAKAAQMRAKGDKPASKLSFFVGPIQDAYNNRIRAGQGLAKPIRTVTPDEELAPDVLEAEWRKRLDYARRNRSWFTAVWGPMPGKSGCRVPSHLLQANDGQFPQGGDWLEQAPVRAA